MNNRRLVFKTPNFVRWPGETRGLDVDFYPLETFELSVTVYNRGICTTGMSLAYAVYIDMTVIYNDDVTVTDI